MEKGSEVEYQQSADFAYSQAYLVHLNLSLMERAKRYGMRMATHEEAFTICQAGKRTKQKLIK